jgi:hypothetical protein
MGSASPAAEPRCQWFTGYASLIPKVTHARPMNASRMLRMMNLAERDAAEGFRRNPGLLC